MLKGFKDFIMRGNVIDLAVGVVIGAAFTAIVTAFSDNIINPLIAGLGGSEFGFGFNAIPGNDATFLNFGALLTAIINFLLIAAVVYFFIVAPMNKLDEMQKRKRGISEDEPAPTDTELLTEIRDLLAGQSKPGSAGTTGTGSTIDPQLP
ncbi:large-conductance mechanosensitive channel protein MscL [Corynebacterium sanguinis]|uniref:Large-conductance mechanosensitive channel n=1 Tax=Corynebacterium sanguinis TaxID=2594913 RepID=A0A6C1TX82_9CORY|nr:large-conductance mechanosensitive channel protein MscL [Corynebacterium sanguinis]MCT1411748.1 large-conductance mechanosensitive channel protein MscL [Corynebacterium sanguinis]MCT1444278.1 large-conductance mechanosensitive channel protein MscL [Corynebacterium sanguinis]MCT1463602.1 large-conductance mechanosensitive channel protein MscL [Corynebacterium sanguinis]MCT1492837.1 large-conductance mechanosensitive channel protein MscL [Corynebacterium sanguinis]MCT1500020.1 large-conductan